MTYIDYHTEDTWKIYKHFKIKPLQDREKNVHLGNCIWFLLIYALYAAQYDSEDHTLLFWKSSCFTHYLNLISPVSFPWSIFIYLIVFIPVGMKSPASIFAFIWGVEMLKFCSSSGVHCTWFRWKWMQLNSHYPETS